MLAVEEALTLSKLELVLVQQKEPIKVKEVMEDMATSEAVLLTVSNPKVISGAEPFKGCIEGVLNHFRIYSSSDTPATTVADLRLVDPSEKDEPREDWP